jgi:hypothetical protein
VFGIGLNDGPRGISPEEHLTHEMKNGMMRITSKDVDGSPHFLDLYYGS